MSLTNHSHLHHLQNSFNPLYPLHCPIPHKDTFLISSEDKVDSSTIRPSMFEAQANNLSSIHRDYIPFDQYLNNPNFHSLPRLFCPTTHTVSSSFSRTLQDFPELKMHLLKQPNKQTYAQTHRQYSQAYFNDPNKPSHKLTTTQNTKEHHAKTTLMKHACNRDHDNNSNTNMNNNFSDNTKDQNKGLRGCSGKDEKYVYRAALNYCSEVDGMEDEIQDERMNKGIVESKDRMMEVDGRSDGVNGGMGGKEWCRNEDTMFQEIEVFANSILTPPHSPPIQTALNRPIRGRSGSEGVADCLRRVLLPGDKHRKLNKLFHSSTQEDDSLKMEISEGNNCSQHLHSQELSSTCKNSEPFNDHNYCVEAELNTQNYSLNSSLLTYLLNPNLEKEVGLESEVLRRRYRENKEPCAHHFFWRDFLGTGREGEGKGGFNEKEGGVEHVTDGAVLKGDLAGRSVVNVGNDDAGGVEGVGKDDAGGVVWDGAIKIGSKAEKRKHDSFENKKFNKMRNKN